MAWACKKPSDEIEEEEEEKETGGMVDESQVKIQDDEDPFQWRPKFGE